MTVVGNSVLQPFGHFPVKVELFHPLLSNIEITHSSPFYLMNNLIGNSQNIEFVAESNINIYNGDIPVSFNLELNINQDLFAKENLNKTYQINLNKFTTVSNDMEAQISLDYFGEI